MYNETFITKIISQVKAKVNQIAFDKLTANAYIDPEKVLQGMKDYGDENLGSYAARTFFGL